MTEEDEATFSDARTDGEISDPSEAMNELLEKTANKKEDGEAEDSGDDRYFTADDGEIEEEPFKEQKDYDADDEYEEGAEDNSHSEEHSEKSFELGEFKYKIEEGELVVKSQGNEVNGMFIGDDEFEKMWAELEAKITSGPKEEEEEDLYDGNY